MSAKDSVIVLVPSEQDLTDPEYRDKYWPNFVRNVTDALGKQGCRIIVGGAVKATLLALALLLPSSASAQEHPSLRLPTLVYAGAAAADVWSTGDCLSVGCHERNPALNWLEPRGAGVMLGFGVAVESTAYVAFTHYVAPKHPKLARIVPYGAAAAHLILFVHNVQEAKEQRAFNARRMR